MHKTTMKTESFAKEKGRVHGIAKVAILSAIAYVLMMLEFPLPLFPPFLKFDFGEIPALLAAFSMGPWAGVLVELIKNVLHLPFSHTQMVGELANFLIGACFVGTAGAIYQKDKTKKKAVQSLVWGGVMMTVAGALVNLYVNIPFFINVMHFPLEAICGCCQSAGNPHVVDMKSLILWAFVPFNILKSAVISCLTMWIYKPLSPLLHR